MVLRKVQHVAGEVSQAKTLVAGIFREIRNATPVDVDEVIRWHSSSASGIGDCFGVIVTRW